MNWYNIVEYIILSLIVIFQMIALTLLYRRKNCARNKNQVHLIGMLFFKEGFDAVFIIITKVIIVEVKLGNNLLIKILRLTINIVLHPTYFLIMTLITADRFLAFYLNIKYPVYVTLKKILKIFGLGILF